jgi:hypothetical protein
MRLCVCFYFSVKTVDKLKESIKCPHLVCGKKIFNKDCKRITEYEGEGVPVMLRDIKICSDCGNDILIDYWK